MSRLLLYSAGSGANRVQDALSGFSVFCFVHAKTVCRYGCMYLLAVFVRVCVYDLNRCSGWWYVYSVNIE